MTLSLTFEIWEYQDQQDIPVEKQAKSWKVRHIEPRFRVCDVG